MKSVINLIRTPQGFSLLDGDIVEVLGNMMNKLAVTILCALELFQMESFVVFIPYNSSDSLTIMAYLSELPCDFLQQFKVILAVRPRNDKLIPIKTIFPLAQRCNISFACRLFFFIFL